MGQHWNDFRETGRFLNFIRNWWFLGGMLSIFLSFNGFKRLSKSLCSLPDSIGKVFEPDSRFRRLCCLCRSITVFESTAQSVSVQSFSPSSQNVFVVSLGGTFSKPEHYAIINNISWNPYNPCMVYLHVPYKSIIGQHIDPYGKKSYTFSARCCSSINCTVREKTLLLHYNFRVGVANSDFPFEFDAFNGFSLGWLEDYAKTPSQTIHGTLVYLLIHECCWLLWYMYR